MKDATEKKKGADRTRRAFFIAAVVVGIAIALIFAPWPEACVGCKGADRDIVASMRSLVERSESIYDNYGTYKNVCSRSQEEAGALDIIEAVRADSRNVVCKESPTAWALEAELARDTEYYFCIDSTRTATFTKGSTIDAYRCGAEK